MSVSLLAVPAAVLVSLTALAVLLSTDWRYSIGALAVQYVGVFILVALTWPIGMAVAKLVAGWMAGAVLGMAVVSLPPRPAGSAGLYSLGQPGEALPASRLFRFFSALLVFLTAASLVPLVAGWIPGVGAAQGWASLVLVGMGLLQLGLTARPLRATLGLLTVMSGFEILYAAVESAVLIAGLLAAANLGLALAGAYLLTAPLEEEEA